MVIKLAYKQNENLRKYVLNYQAIQAVFKTKSSINQGIFSSIKNLDPSLRWFYRTIGSDHPLYFWQEIAQND